MFWVFFFCYFCFRFECSCWYNLFIFCKYGVLRGWHSEVLQFGIAKNICDNWPGVYKLSAIITYTHFSWRGGESKLYIWCVTERCSSCVILWMAWLLACFSNPKLEISYLPRTLYYFWVPSCWTRCSCWWDPLKNDVHIRAQTPQSSVYRMHTALGIELKTFASANTAAHLAVGFVASRGNWQTLS